MMALTTTRLSGSGAESDDDGVLVDDGADMLAECPGGCGKKVLKFSTFVDDDWGDSVEVLMCLECRAKPLKHTPRRSDV